MQFTVTADLRLYRSGEVNSVRCHASLTRSVVGVARTRDIFITLMADDLYFGCAERLTCRRPS